MVAYSIWYLIDRIEMFWEIIAEDKKEMYEALNTIKYYKKSEDKNILKYRLAGYPEKKLWTIYFSCKKWIKINMEEIKMLMGLLPPHTMDIWKNSKYWERIERFGYILDNNMACWHLLKK